MSKFHSWENNECIICGLERKIRNVKVPIKETRGYYNQMVTRYYKDGLEVNYQICVNYHQLILDF